MRYELHISATVRSVWTGSLTPDIVVSYFLHYGQIDSSPWIKLLTYTRHNDNIFAKGFPHLASHHSV